MQTPLLVFERACSPTIKAFISTASHEFLTEYEWDMIMSLLKVLSPLEVATRVLSGVQYPSLGCTFVGFHQVIQKLDDFLHSVIVPTHASLALALKTHILQRKNELQHFNGTLSFLSMSVDPRFKLAYVQDPIKEEQIKGQLFDHIAVTYPDSLSCISKPDKKRRRAQNVSLHDFLPSVETSEGPNETLEEELTRRFSSPTVFIGADNDVFSW
jgi:hypothetical protein